MKIKRNFSVITVLAAAVTIVALASFNKPDPPLYTNLKVLPKNISS